MAFTTEALDKLMQRPVETEHLEFKEAKSQYDANKLYKYCIAIANERGGLLILGVTNKPPRKVVGTTAFENTGKLAAQILRAINLRVEVEELDHPNGRVLILRIPARPQATPLQYEGAYWMRVGEELQPMTPEHLKKIIGEGTPDFLKQIAKSDLISSDITNLLDTQSFFDLLRIPYPSTRAKVLEKLVAEKLIVYSEEHFHITNLGAILIAKKLKEFPSLENKRVRVIIYSGKNKAKAIKEITGSMGYANGFKGLIQYIEDQLPLNEEIKKAIRKTVHMYPMLSVRELVANALIHQDFDITGASVTIEIYKDRIDISNPGVPIITTDRFIDEYQSRNEKLAGLMRRMGICEERGSGIDKVIIESELYQLPPPDFRASENRTSALMFSPQKIGVMTKPDKIRACYQHCVLKYLSGDRMTNQSIRERFKIDARNTALASRIISDTLKAKKIKLDDPENSSKRHVKYAPYWA